MLVAFKQLVPEHRVTLGRGLVRIRVKHFPAVFVLAQTASGALLRTDTAAVLAWLGFLLGWAYLRFYKAGAANADLATGRGARGDPSETFAFAYFWPDAVHGPVAAAADALFALLVALRVCSPFSAESVASSSQAANVRDAGGLPLSTQDLRHGGAAAAGAGAAALEQSDRRRELALRALNERLAAGPPLAGAGGGGGGGARALGTARTAPPSDAERRGQASMGSDGAEELYASSAVPAKQELA